MISSKLFRFLLVGVLCVACTKTEKPGPQVLGAENREEYKVMSVVLKDFFGDHEGEDDTAGYKQFDTSGLTFLSSVAHGDTALYKALRKRFGLQQLLADHDTLGVRSVCDSLIQKRVGLGNYFTVKDYSVKWLPARRDLFANEYRGADLPHELVESFNDNNEKPCLFDGNAFPNSLIVQLVPTKQIDSVEVDGDWWTTFYQRYPLSNGLIAFSRVGFDSDRNLALVCVEVDVLPLGGTGWYLLLERSDSTWKIVTKTLCAAVVLACRVPNATLPTRKTCRSRHNLLHPKANLLRLNRHTQAAPSPSPPSLDSRGCIQLWF